jgi:hypothetical protein
MPPARLHAIASLAPSLRQASATVSEAWMNALGCSIQQVDNQLQIPKLRAGCRVWVVRWLTVHAKHCCRPPRPLHSRVANLVKQWEAYVAGAGRQCQHTTTAASDNTARFTDNVATGSSAARHSTSAAGEVNRLYAAGKQPRQLTT